MPFETLIASDRPILADGAIATNLFAAGLVPGAPPETWNDSHPDRVEALHRAYVAAGSDVILTNSFGGNRRRLAPFGLTDRAATLNAAAVRLARAAAVSGPKRVLVAGCIGPTGDYYRPPTAFDSGEVETLFREQMTVLADGGIDLVWIETMSAAQEMRCAASAAAALGLPYVLTASFDDGGRTGAGLTPEGFVDLARSLPHRPTAIGANCGAGPSEALATLLPLARAAPDLPLIVKPNAGLPVRIDGAWRWPAAPAEMASFSLAAFEAGARVIGGCCGTAPAHIAAIRQAVDHVSL